MASPAARKRLMKEQLAMQAQPPPFAFARPDETDILKWHYVLRGPPDTPYVGGEYHGTLTFPSSYPFKPPEIKMITPNGRFQPNTSICTTFSSFHPASWNPAWSVASILTGLLSFFLDDEIGTGGCLPLATYVYSLYPTGGIKCNKTDRLILASKSRQFNRQNKQFLNIFNDLIENDELNKILDKSSPQPILPLNLHAINNNNNNASQKQESMQKSQTKNGILNEYKWVIIFFVILLISRFYN